MILATVCIVTVAAQDKDTCVYYLTPDALLQKEVVLQSANQMFDLKLMVGVKWMQIDNKIQLIFDRKTVQGNDFLLLLFSLSNKSEPVSAAIDSKSGKKVLWSKLKSPDAQYMKYFLASDNLKIEDFNNGYKTLANNNEEEFTFELNTSEDFVITLLGFFVVKTEKRPWYAFSKRDKKVQFVTKPFELYIQFERKPDKCEIAPAVVAYIEAYKKKLDEDIADLLDAQKNKSCTYFGLLKDIMRRTFVELNDKCERFTGCEDIAEAIKIYNNAFEKAYAVQCSAPAAPAATCSFSESELSSINNRLKNLQMKINVKKRNNESRDEETKEYRTIKTTILPRLTPECRKRYKDLIDALESYCVNIESLL
jgi:hypothetical protein